MTLEPALLMNVGIGQYNILQLPIPAMAQAQALSVMVGWHGTIEISPNLQFGNDKSNHCS